MNNRWVIIDGYSVLHAWPQFKKLGNGSLEKRRNALIKLLVQYADYTQNRVTVVFDGYAAKRKPSKADAKSRSKSTIEIIYSDTGKTADDVIERIIAQAEIRNTILVVTSDHLERQTVESLGAHSMSSEMFEIETRTILQDLHQAVKDHSRQRHLGSIRDRIRR